MARLQDVEPAWVCDMVDRQGIAGAITTLNNMGDTSEAKAHYASHAARLAAWGTVAGAPSTASLPPIVPI
jgi:hypothetical protein